MFDSFDCERKQRCQTILFWQVKVIEDTVGTAVPAHVLRLAGTFRSSYGSIVAEINKQECRAMFELCSSQVELY